jgi:hypothetical protein
MKAIFNNTLFFLFLSIVPAASQEWQCKSSPPPNTKNENLFEILSFDEDRKIAEEEGIKFCNKLFKTNQCKIDYCKLVPKK